uniref:ARID domain-containing protein n=1 Tax=Ciona intestinalis TaxID=7719 RepID=F6UXY9_CIOIN
MSNFSNDGEKLAFLNGLKQYLEDRGKVLIPYPRLAGKVLDLHDLYNRVTSLGGYNKVTEKELWDDFLAEYNFPSCSSSLSYGLRAVYQRFLEEYEKVHHFGEDEGNNLKCFFNRSRQKILGFFNLQLFFLTDQDRQIHGLSSTRITARYGSPCNYERLVSSLISCLPNEIDFAINACTLLSGESRHVLRLPRCPQVLNALLLHAGIVSNYINIIYRFAGNWNKCTSKEFSSWWKVLGIGSYRFLIFLCLPCVLQSLAPINPIYIPTFIHYNPQISLVLLNLSFEEVNLVLLAKSRELVRFVFLCIHSEYSALKQTGLDILGNVSSRMNLNDLGYSIAQCTYKTLTQCTSSADKFDRIRGFEILGNLCSCEANKENLIVAVTDAVISAAILCLPLSDIELIVAALEALYKLSKLGEETCTRIMLIPHSI